MESKVQEFLTRSVGLGFVEESPSVRKRGAKCFSAYTKSVRVWVHPSRIICERYIRDGSFLGRVLHKSFKDVGSALLWAKAHFE